MDALETYKEILEDITRELLQKIRDAGFAVPPGFQQSLKNFTLSLSRKELQQGDASEVVGCINKYKHRLLGPGGYFAGASNHDTINALMDNVTEKVIKAFTSYQSHDHGHLRVIEEILGAGTSRTPTRSPAASRD